MSAVRIGCNISYSGDEGGHEMNLKRTPAAIARV